MPRDLSGTIFRGQPDGKLRTEASWRRPLFFAESIEHANLYGRGTQSIACVIQGQRVLDLTNPDFRNPDHIRLCELMADEFDDWTCRYSGEPRDVWSYLIAGDLYDYEGDGTGDRWNAVLRIGLDMGFDAVRIMDATDGTHGQPSAIWVIQNADNVRLATPGEELAARLKQQPWHDVKHWAEVRDDSFAARLRRLSRADDEYRLDRVGWAEVADQVEPGAKLQLFRANPAGCEIRPGDWVAIDHEYARQHLRGNSTTIATLSLVDPDDIFWAGTDEREFFYLPKAWRLDGLSAEQLLQSLSQDALRHLMDGEMNRIARHREHIQRIDEHISNEIFDPDTCGLAHGPEHWERVSLHGVAVARSMGLDPLIPHIFGMIHDSHRENEGMDPDHGRRAAEFVREHRHGLFNFLGDQEVEDLAHACELHSDGYTEGTPCVQACWDADRLDLWRVGVEPLPQYLCTSYARRPSTIRSAHAVWRGVTQHRQDVERECAG